MSEIADAPLIELSLENEVGSADPFANVPPLSAERLPPNFRKHVEASSPAPLRGMAARGLVPLAPSDMCHALAMLVNDADANIAASARKTASSLPDKILATALRDEAQNPRVLHFFAEAQAGKDGTLELILLNNATHDATVAQIVAATGNSRLIDIVANNQLRLLRDEGVLRALLSNANTPRSVADSVADFAIRSGVELYDLPAMVEAHIRVHGRPPRDPNAQQQAEEPPAPSAEQVMQEFGEEVSGEDAPPMEEGKRLTLAQRVMKMTVAQKVKLATLGNKEARTILLRDTNKIVCMAALNSPRITDGEIIGLANSKTAPDEVLRRIMNNRDWTRIYQVRLSLVRNPKVPLATAMKMLNTLRDAEVKDLSGNKNIPSAVRLAAKKMIEKKTAPKQDDKH